MHHLPEATFFNPFSSHKTCVNEAIIEFFPGQKPIIVANSLYSHVVFNFRILAEILYSFQVLLAFADSKLAGRIVETESARLLSISEAAISASGQEDFLDNVSASLFLATSGLRRLKKLGVPEDEDNAAVSSILGMIEKLKQERDDAFLYSW